MFLRRCTLSAGTLYNGNATRAYDVNTKLGITGLGVKVGVIDTGERPCATVS